MAVSKTSSQAGMMSIQAGNMSNQAGNQSNQAGNMSSQVRKNFTNSVRNPRGNFEIGMHSLCPPPPGIIIVQNHMINRVNH